MYKCNLHGRTGPYSELFLHTAATLADVTCGLYNKTLNFDLDDRNSYPFQQQQSKFCEDVSTLTQYWTSFQTGFHSCAGGGGVGSVASFITIDEQLQ